jgi:hypothetical protein
MKYRIDVFKAIMVVVCCVFLWLFYNHQQNGRYQAIRLEFGELILDTRTGETHLIHHKSDEYKKSDYENSGEMIKYSTPVIE